MNYPTLNNPLLIYIPISVPSLKNAKRPLVSGGKIIIAKNPSVLRFQKTISEIIREQHQSSGFDKIPAKMDVLVYARIYRDNSNQDFDNMYTTLQEALFKQSDIIEDDRYVVGFFVEEGLKVRRGHGMSLLAVACSEKRSFSYYEQIGSLVRAVKDRVDKPIVQSSVVPSIVMEDLK